MHHGQPVSRDKLDNRFLVSVYNTACSYEQCVEPVPGYSRENGSEMIIRAFDEAFADSSAVPIFGTSYRERLKS
jgi:hypothetical protein